MDVLKKNIEKFDENSVDKIWPILKTSIQHILMDHRICKTLPIQKLNNLTLKIVLLNFSEIMYKELKEMIIAHLKNNVKEDVLEALNNNFLQALNDIWKNYYISINIISDIVMPMEVHYIEQKEIDSFAQMSFFLFYDLVYNYGYIRDHFRMAFLNMITLGRRSGIIDRLTVSNACEMLMQLGKTNFVYKNDVEEPFLKSSVKYYKMESRSLLSKGDAGIYIRFVESLIVKEENLAHLFSRSTKDLLQDIINTELIGNNIRNILEMNNSGISFMIENNKVHDLACMYKLLIRVDDGLKAMTYCMSQYLRTFGKKIVQVKDTNTDVSVNCIQTLLDLKDKFNFLLINSFMKNEMFKKAIYADFEYIVNLNSQLPEYLSLFMDYKLKSTENNFEIILKKTKDIFCFFKDKGIYESFCNQYLTKILLLNNDNPNIVSSKIKAHSISILPFACQLQHIDKSMITTKTTVKALKENGTPAKNIMNTI